MGEIIKSKIVLNFYKHVAPDIYVEQYGHELCHGSKPPVDTSLQMYRLHYIKKGECILFTNNNKITLKQNSFFVLIPNSDTKYSILSNKETELYWVAYNGYMSKSITKSLGLSNQPFTTLKSRLPLNLFTENFNLPALGTLNQHLIFQKNLLQILQIILQENQNAVEQIENIQQNISPYITQTVQIINQELSSPHLSIQYIAQQLHLHPNYLSHLFKTRFNMPFTQYIMLRRMEYAIILMERGHTKVKQIAMEVGFNDQYYFSKTFKKVYGASPCHMIKRIQNQKENES